jgi:hypothetical protein
MSTLFLGAGAAIIAVLTRGDEHQLTSHLLVCLRAIMVVLTIIAFSAVLVLASVREPSDFWLYFMGLGALAVALFFCMLAALCLAGQRRRT